MICLHQLSIFPHLVIPSNHLILLNMAAHFLFGITVLRVGITPQIILFMYIHG